MGKILACRACLATDVKLYCMCKFRLKKAYENVTDTKVTKGQNYPQYLCSYCAMLVLKCEAFKEKCERAKELLNITIMQYNKVTTNHIKNLDREANNLELPLSIHKVNMEPKSDYQDDLSYLQNEILLGKNTIIDDFVDDFKEICSYAENFEGPDPIDLLDDYTSSDDEPLATKVKKKLNMDPEERTEETNIAMQETELFQDDIEVVVLTREQQLEEVQARKSSVNYQNSVFKCDKCFKGFLTDSTFKNHMYRHDPECGPYECEVCLTRWPDVKSLRGHESSAHKKKYLCKMCNNVSRSLHRAREHCLWHSGFMFRCKVCGASFQKSTSYLTHLRLQHPSKHCCDLCGESFIGETGLNIHKKKVHRYDQKGRKEHKCPHCEVQFRNMDALRMHSSMSDPNGSCDTTLKPCLECGHSFLTDESVRDHMRTHNKNVVKCHDCNRTFAHKRSIAIHYQRVHLGVKLPKPVPEKANKLVSVCEVCGFKCLSKVSLTHHQRIHTGEKPYQCPECPNRFSVYQRLKIHLRTHTGERPYKCAECPKAFKHKAALNRHSRVHSGVKPYHCPQCGKAFSQSNSMKLHVMTVHQNMPAPYRSPRAERRPPHLYVVTPVTVTAVEDLHVADVALIM